VEQQVIFNPDLIQRYDKTGLRYTSYPTAVQFHEGFGEAQYRIRARAANDEAKPRPLSLYFHIPFCATVCYYCACNKIVTKNRAHAVAYVDHLRREVELQAQLFGRERAVEQLHWGGGTPTFLNQGQMRALMRTTARHFNLLDGDRGEYSIEIDPRTVNEQTMVLLREFGFNRMSLGVQDFDPDVQKSVNRIQSEEQTLAVMDAARRHGFKSINVDLIYGLPLQTVDSFSRTLDKIIAASPDRLSVFNYAHLPQRFKVQRQINEADLPTPEEKLKILQLTVELLTEAGYVYIGMDHFAKPDDELAVAQRNGTLWRNFQGYSTHGNCDLIGMGMTAIGMIGDSYAQNVHAVEDYYQRIDAGRLPVYRGVELTKDDRLRREIIMQLICNLALDIPRLEEKWQIKFMDYFAAECQGLEGMVLDGLIALEGGVLCVRPAGRLLIRNICMVFDQYLHKDPAKQKFSRVI
jgi:oxygen-independent coproporphyrinogen-3 oxidase